MKFPISMTAFGRGEHLSENIGWTVEIKSVNHRFFDIRIKIPRQYAALEERIKKEITPFYSRGHIEVVVTPAPNLVEAKTLGVNLPLALQYGNCLLEIKNYLDLPASGTELTLVANYPNVIYAMDEKEDLEAIWDVLRQALLQALELTRDMREREGLSLKNDLLTRLDFLAATKEQVKEKIPELTAQKQVSLQERIAKLAKDIDIDPSRIVQEIAIIADKADVTEELVRLTSHIDQFRHFLEQQEPVGRRLDFLLQELLREINTMASKISDAGIAHQAVELKNELEKMREQVQNLE
ncbi:MAG: YicC family protein [Proteobacteria bacterium]|nr:YicC family protein [Pseudomonadota bacterium]MBU4297543.1 YicC family protein [Pseudomonadota bacterium]MCG2746945.1 YicC family protein [Desulfobulbaceae bacterium]